jgi:hypothetical protein
MPGGLMIRIIELVNQKNHFLEKFYSLNENELINFAQGEFDNLESFYSSREKILEMIKYIDDQLNKTQINTTETTSEDKLELKSALAIKDEYVSRILEQDLEILAHIESAKSEIIRELQDLKRNRKIVGSFKSKTFNRRLDEEV